MNKKERKVTESIKKLSLKRGDILIVDKRDSMAAVIANMKIELDFEVPVVFVDDIDSIRILRSG